MNENFSAYEKFFSDLHSLREGAYESREAESLQDSGWRVGWQPSSPCPHRVREDNTQLMGYIVCVDNTQTYLGEIEVYLTSSGYLIDCCYSDCFFYSVEEWWTNALSYASWERPWRCNWRG